MIKYLNRLSSSNGMAFGLSASIFFVLGGPRYIMAFRTIAQTVQNE